MSIRSAQAIVVEFTTRVFATGVGTNADSLPVGTLVVNGVDNAASVTVTNVDGGRYKAAVTLPTLAVGDLVELSIAATVSAVADKEIIWRDTKDFFAGSIPDVAAGGAGGLFIAGTNAATTVTTSFTTTFTGNLTGSVASVTAGVTVTTNSDKTGYSLSQSFPANFAALGITAGGHVSNVDTLTTYTGNTLQTGDSFARIGAAGASLTAVVLAAGGLANVLIDGKTLPAAMQIIAASVAGKVSGAGSGTETFLGLDGVTTRFVSTVDTSGNRTGTSYP